MAKETKNNIGMQFIDESGDRSSFTITPNVILHTCGATVSGVYSYIKMRAGENGEFFEAQEKAIKKLKICRNTYRKILKELEKSKRIKCIGTKVTKTSPVNVYVILDVWKENEIWKEKMKKDTNKRHVQYRSISSKKAKEMFKVGPSELFKPGPLIRTSTNKNHIISAQGAETLQEFDLSEKIQTYLKDSQRHIQIIALWIQQTALKPENERQLQSIVTRNVRAAKNLSGYSDKRIINAINHIKGLDYIEKYTLETVGKYIDVPAEERDPGILELQKRAKKHAEQRQSVTV